MEAGPTAETSTLIVPQPSNPESPVSAIPGAVLPTIVLPTNPKTLKRRIRSFGNFEEVSGSPDRTRGGEGDEGGVNAAAPSSTAAVNGEAVQKVPRGGSLLDRVTHAAWDERATQGLFRYDVTNLPSTVLPGTYGFLAQFNEGRHSKKRPTEYTVAQVMQPFDPAKFNFRKALQKEVLYQVERGEEASYSEAATVGPDPNLVFINISPIDYGHVLLVPRVMSDLPQVIQEDTLLLALQYCHYADNPHFRMCYNSLGAYGTVNHLHFQAYYLQAPFAVERAPTEAIPGLTQPHGVRVSSLAKYPVRGLCFEAGPGPEGLHYLAKAVAAVCTRLQAANVPHNMFVVDCGHRLFMYPNAYAAAKAAGKVPEALLDTQVDPACFEISGHMVYKRAQDFEDATEENVAQFLSYASFSPSEFDNFLQVALEVTSSAHIAKP